MNKNDIRHNNIGISLNSNAEVSIRVWAPKAEKVALVLSEKNEKFPLTRKEFGYWQGSDIPVKNGDRYTIETDGKNGYPDPASLYQPEGIDGPSEAVDLHRMPWTDQRWKNHALKDYILYELHTGTFSPEGNFEGIEKKLPYLKELGVTAIEIMPVAQFSGARNWGYDGVLPFAVQHSYGGPHALQKLVNACHNNGLAVVLDVVYNHLGPEGNNLDKFGPYFTDKYKTPWGTAINFDDAGSDAIRRYFIENVLMWFRDFHIDALRLDAVHAIKDFGPKHILAEIKENVNELMAATGRKHYLIAECDLNDSKYIQPLEEGGYGMDAQWIDEFHHALRVTSGNPKTGYYADFDGINHLAKSYRDAYVYDGIYSSHRDKVFGTSAKDIPGDRFVVFSQNHDHVGNRMLGERIGTLVSFEMQKLMAATVLMSPFMPMLFMGEEYGEKNPFLYFVSHAGKELVQAVRDGRKREFAAFHTDGEFPDPQSEKIFAQSKLNWDLQNEPDHRAMLRYYKELIRLRKNLPALSNPDRSNLIVEVLENQQILMIHRKEDTHHVMYILNFSNDRQEIEINLKREGWTLLMNSASEAWAGNSTESIAIPETGKIQISPQTFLLFENKNV